MSLGYSPFPSLLPPPPPSNTAARITITRSRDMFSLKTWTVSSATTRTKTRNSTRGILQLRVQFDYPDEIGTPRSKSNALQLAFKDPAQGFLTSLLNAGQSRTLDVELEAPANASRFVEDPLPVLLRKTLKKVSGEAVPFTREQRSLPNDATRLASKDSTPTFLFNRPFSGICPVLWSLIPSCQLTSQAFLLT